MIPIHSKIVPSFDPSPRCPWDMIKTLNIHSNSNKVVCLFGCTISRRNPWLFSFRSMEREESKYFSSFLNSYNILYCFSKVLGFFSIILESVYIEYSIFRWDQYRLQRNHGEWTEMTNGRVPFTRRSNFQHPPLTRHQQSTTRGPVTPAWKPIKELLMIGSTRTPRISSFRYLFQFVFNNSPRYSLI